MSLTLLDPRMIKGIPETDENLEVSFNKKANANLFINGDFSVNQRYDLNTTTTLFDKGIFASDRWKFRPANLVGGTISVLNANNSLGSYIGMIHAGATAGGYIQQNIDTTGWNISLASSRNPLPSDKITVSFGFNKPQTSEDMRLNISLGLVKGATTISNIVQSDFITLSSSASVDKYSITVDFPTLTDTAALASECALQVYINYIGVSDTVPDGRYDFYQVKAEWGDTATPFVPDDPQVNLAKCQRYGIPIKAAQYSLIGVGHIETSTQAGIVAVSLAVPASMRKAPSLTGIISSLLVKNDRDSEVISFSPVSATLINNSCTIQFKGDTSAFQRNEIVQVQVAQGGTLNLFLDAEI